MSKIKGKEKDYTVEKDYHFIYQEVLDRKANYIEFCPECGLSSFSHFHKKGTLPKDFIRDNSAPDRELKTEREGEKDFEDLAIKLLIKVANLENEEGVWYLNGHYVVLDIFVNELKSLLSRHDKEIRKEAYEQAIFDVKHIILIRKEMYSLDVQRSKILFELLTDIELLTKGKKGKEL